MYSQNQLLLSGNSVTSPKKIKIKSDWTRNKCSDTGSGKQVNSLSRLSKSIYFRLNIMLIIIPYCTGKLCVYNYGKYGRNKEVRYCLKMFFGICAQWATDGKLWQSLLHINLANLVVCLKRSDRLTAHVSVLVGLLSNFAKVSEYNNFIIDGHNCQNFWSKIQVLIKSEWSFKAEIK